MSIDKYQIKVLLSDCGGYNYFGLETVKLQLYPTQGQMQPQVYR